jgi:signal transduction histidine kinase/CheY-like chemotaxis protein
MTSPHRIARTPSQLLRAWLRDWGGILTLSTVGFALLYAVIVLFQLGDADTRAYFANLGMPLITFVAAVLAARAGMNPTLDMRTRWGWRVLALAFLANGLGSTAWFIYESILQVYPEVSWADVGWLGFYPLLLSAVLLFPTAPRGRREQATFWLDTCTVLIGAGMLVWYFSIGPRASAESTSTFLHLVSLAYPIGDFVTMFALTTIALSRPDPRSAWPLRIIGLGLCFNIAANLGYASLLFDGTYQSGMWPSATWALAFCICTIGAHVQHWEAQHVAAGAVPRAAKADAISIVPYFAIVIGFSLLLTVAYHMWIRPLGDLILGCVILTGLVIVRQIFAVRENIRLAAERNAATQANQLKTEFLATMSHELRTPLNSIINFSRILSSGARGPVNEGQLDYLNRVRQSGEQLLGLINDILDLSKIEAGKMELVKETFAIEELIQSIMASATGLTKEKPIEWRHMIAPGLPPIAADRQRIRQVVLNLISNAAKFTDAGSITVQVTTGAQQLIIRVIDSGIGIAHEHLTTIFEEFRQIEGASNRRYEGTGLGLSICKHLVELHGGQLWVESTLGGGSTFSFSLPLPPTATHPEAAAPAVAIASRAGIPVLVIDDDPASIEIVSAYLGRDGYAVYGVTDSARALDEVRRLRPAAIILDVLMPHQDGWELLSELKTDPELHAIPVALYTIVEEQKRGFYLGASAYLLKPIDETQLRTTIAQLVARDATILVIDDDSNAIDVTVGQLEAIGDYQVITACGGQNGLERIAHAAPDLIILDLMMPDVDGFTVLARLEQDPLKRDIPVVVLTAKELSGPERAFLNERVHGLLAKGHTTPECLLAKVTDLLRTSARRPALHV